MADETAALIYPFRHGSAEALADRVNRATRLYEYSLRYYVAGLGYAGSPYAYHTIGSTMAVNANHYCKVRGFPRRQAGEDFYLLNKLAKVGAIRQLKEGDDCEPVDITARLSDRVPFGTGAAVTKMMDFEDPEKEFMVYHPAVFSELRCWLESWPGLWLSQSADIRNLPANQPSQVLVAALEDAGAASALDHALQHSSDEGRFLRHMHTWFDAFRTLKLIHYLRDHRHASVNVGALARGDSIEHLLPFEPVLPLLHRELHCLSPAY